MSMRLCGDGDGSMIPAGSETAWSALRTHRIIRAHYADKRFQRLVLFGYATFKPVLPFNEKWDFLLIEQPEDK